jgi:5-oxopent-3-ene-1,2,5-tricarboxylate decarboxylase/2-hydroxyhepta-2,4-diene-1,7-dioate isomerase
MIVGTAYGIVLNDSMQRESLHAAFREAPYLTPPEAPVLYIKPRGCFTSDGGTVRVPAEAADVEVGATIGLLFGEDVDGRTETPIEKVAAVCVAIDFCLPHPNYYRPALAERCRDNFLPLGNFVGRPADLDAIEIATLINGVGAHRWSLSRLVRRIPDLIGDVSSFMTLGAGDLLLVGLPGDAPRARAGDRISVAARGLGMVSVQLQAEDRS